MNVEEKAHDLAVFTLKLLIDKGEYKIDLKRDTPDVISTISFEYNRIYQCFIEELKNLNS